MKRPALLLFIFLVSIDLPEAIAQPAANRPRTIVTTDGEVDDQDSFIRLLLYSNEFDLVGLIYSSSQWHYKGDGKDTKFTSALPVTQKLYGERMELRWPGTDWMEEMIDRYASIYPRLSMHSRSFPSPVYLRSIVKVGNIDFEGEMEKVTEGSEWIKGILLDESTQPVYLQIWGGTNTVARALKSIEEQFKGSPEWPAISKRVSEKAIIYAVLDQDDTYRKYIAPNWPKIKVLYNEAQFWNFAYLWPRVVPTDLQSYLRGPWFRDNIKFLHGPLCGAYYLWGDGTAIQNDFDHTQGDTANLAKNGMTQYDFISEGDSPAFLHLVDVGLRNLEDISYGGWGGRMIRSKTNPNRWEDGDEVTDFNVYTQKMDKAYPQTRWIAAIQNDFASRADWCVREFRKANHPPVVTLVGSKDITATAGQTLKLEVIPYDPDNNSVAVHWWQYFEADSYQGQVRLTDPSTPAISFVVQSDAKKGDTIHMIAEVTDDGTPPLTRYQRIIITVR